MEVVYLVILRSWWTFCLGNLITLFSWEVYNFFVNLSWLPCYLVMLINLLFRKVGLIILLFMGKLITLWCWVTYWLIVHREVVSWLPCYLLLFSPSLLSAWQLQAWSNIYTACVHVQCTLSSQYIIISIILIYYYTPLERKLSVAGIPRYCTK